ncbi:cytochrome c maturation protein CcmE [Deinococcus psychrotolerans]|uniref:Cytochrome c-type biogenesis protein CcmE n=1 Tax=Deinococcus psychrotolerans TaxID=2489213 RepID=A0A3G8YDU1_9DEIO|nr:cytochrome c maturation protein CcmE [Deinococcus psychrotolerans]AZI43145.1 cytochrome c maturation protein CcmE [Deinococcus psychrotolerans]
MSAPSSPQLPQARRRRKNPLPYVLAGVALAGLLTYIIFGNLAQSIEYFVTPTEYKAQAANLQGHTVRIGGLVRAVKYDRNSLDLNFNVTDGSATFPVVYQGAVSDLFKENQGVVVRGTFNAQNVFHANELIVKHSEEYRIPRSQSELKDMLKNAKDANAEGQ